MRLQETAEYIFFFSSFPLLYHPLSPHLLPPPFQHCNDDVHNCQSDMNIMGAWKRGYTGKDVVVTILDDGIERNHPDLFQNYVSVYVCACRASMSVRVCARVCACL